MEHLSSDRTNSPDIADMSETTGEMEIRSTAHEDKNALQLRVAEAYHKDAGKGIARIGVSAMTQLGLENGGVVEIRERTRSTPLPGPALLKILKISSG